MKKQPTYMTWEQLKSHYPDSWVLLLNPDSPLTGLEVHGGEFVYKNKNRNRVYEKASQLPDGSFFRVAFTGEFKLPENTVLCL